MTKVYIGIDPGKSGGLVAVYSNFPSYDIELVPMPQTDRDIWDWFNDWFGGDIIAAMEKVTSSPQMGVTSAFTFGRGFGKLEMALTAAGIPLIDPEGTRPHDWQKALKIPKRKPHTKKKKVVNRKGKIVTKRYGGETDTQWKKRLRDMAQKLFPKLPLWKETEGEQLAVCDALLIAEYCRRKDQGKL